MSEMVERVARAIYDAENGIDGDQIADMLYDDIRIIGSVDECRAMTLAVCRMAARAAIAAMREPTEVMVRDGRAEIKPDHLPADDGDAVGCWRAMIDAALGGVDG